MEIKAALLPLTLNLLLLLLPNIIQSKDNNEGRGHAQCAATEDLQPWNGTIAIREKCSYDNRTRNWTIPFPTNITNIEGNVSILLTFVNFTQSLEDQGDNSLSNCDSSDRIKINGILGAPPTICRGTEATMKQSYFIHKNAINSSLHIEYTHENDSNDQTFTIEYRYPDYPCFYCSEKQNCEPAECMSSDQHCQSLKDAYTCEDPDPCLDHPCENSGTCIRADPFKCICPGGFTGPTCRFKIWCYGISCENGGVCDESNFGQCVCPLNAWGEHCQYQNDGTLCSHGIDEYPQSRITWNETKMGDIDTQLCPYANGTATRRCIEVNGKAQWSQPDLSLCISPQFQAFSVDADNLSDAKEVTTSALVNITSGIGKAVNNKNRKRLYAGDLSSASNTVSKLAPLVKKVDADINHLGSITERSVAAQDKNLKSVQDMLSAIENYDPILEEGEYYENECLERWDDSAPENSLVASTSRANENNNSSTSCLKRKSDSRFIDMAKRFKMQEYCGDNIDDTLAMNVTDLFRKGIDDERGNEHVKDEQNPRPENCGGLVVVKTNAMVWDAIPH
ncbi:hypothetical protein ACF0H5_010568 [Mactra antiquata]